MSKNRAAQILSVLVVCAFASAMLTLLSTVIAPGQVRWTAHSLCDAPYTDPFIVAYRAGRGGTNYTMYCVGERGEHQDVGWMNPYLIMWAVYFLVITPITGLALLLRRLSTTRP
ncbi:hypothetical protein [Actinomadura formosensis]|uniref:hypothetical protein n=1 Tax=Actinomadura formosensis TaxID=60706 RepID=UPI003D937C42